MVEVEVVVVVVVAAAVATAADAVVVVPDHHSPGERQPTSLPKLPYNQPDQSST